jgi:hypothetical protein
MRIAPGVTLDADAPCHSPNGIVPHWTYVHCSRVLSTSAVAAGLYSAARRTSNAIDDGTFQATAARQDPRRPHESVCGSKSRGLHFGLGSHADSPEADPLSDGRRIPLCGRPRHPATRRSAHQPQQGQARIGQAAGVFSLVCLRVSCPFLRRKRTLRRYTHDCP